MLYDVLITDNNIFVFLTFFKFFNYTQLSKILSLWNETRFVSWSLCFKHSITIIVFTQWTFYNKFSKKTNQNSNVFVFTLTLSLIYLQYHKNLQQSYRHLTIIVDNFWISRAIDFKFVFFRCFYSSIYALSKYIFAFASFVHYRINRTSFDFSCFFSHIFFYFFICFTFFF